MAPTVKHLKSMSEFSLGSMPCIIDAILACKAFVNSACGGHRSLLGAAISMTITACEAEYSSSGAMGSSVGRMNSSDCTMKTRFLPKKLHFRPWSTM